MEDNIIDVLVIVSAQAETNAWQQWVAEKNLPYRCSYVTTYEEIPRSKIEASFDLIVFTGLGGEEKAFTWISRHKETPVIVCVPPGEEDTAVRALNAGAWDFIIKDSPGNFLKLFPFVVERAIGKKQISYERERDKNEYNSLFLRQKSLLKAFPDMIFISDRNGTYIDIKSDSEQKKAIPTGDTSGKQGPEFGLSPACLHLIHKNIETVLKSSEMHTLEYELNTSAGWGYFEARIVPLDQSNVLTIVRDITYSKRIQEETAQSKNLESIGILAAGVAHDFNNLLTGILGNISLARVSIPPEERLFKILTEAEKTALKAADLIQRLIIFSREDWITRKEVMLIQILKNALHLLAPNETSACDMEIDDDIYSLYGDASQLSQVIYNLLRNAAEAMQDTGPIILRASNVSIGTDNKFALEEGNYVKISIADKGRGIPKENLHVIFTPYFSTKEDRGPKGTGLGLAISYAIVRKHKGNIIVHSEEGIGTTFDVYLPAIKDDLYLMKEEIREISKKIKGRILLMDDDPLIIEITGEMLRKLGYEVVSCSEGQCILEAYKQSLIQGKPFHAVVLDIVNKIGMAGKETLQKLKEIDPQVKAIAISGYLHDFNVDDLIKCGFRVIIPKPYKIEHLMDAINKIILTDL